jgi:hypothetical protein
MNKLPESSSSILMRPNADARSRHLSGAVHAQFIKNLLHDLAERLRRLRANAFVIHIPPEIIDVAKLHRLTWEDVRRSNRKYFRIARRSAI